MHHLDLPAGSTVRLHATARPGAGVHRWDIRVLDAGPLEPGATARLAYGSQIGAGDCEQRVDIPAQDADCRLEVWGRHAVVGGWKDDRCSVDDDTPSCLQIGFSDRALPNARKDDVLLSFTFESADRQPAQEATMAKSQKRSNREIRKPKQEKPKAEAAPRSFLSASDRSTATLSGPRKGERA